MNRIQEVPILFRKGGGGGGARPDDHVVCGGAGEKIYKLHDAETGETTLPAARPEENDRLTAWDWLGLMGTIGMMGFIILKMIANMI